MNATTPAATSTGAPAWLRATASLSAAAIVVVGIWVAGAVVTDDFRTSMALTGVWFVAVSCAAALVWRRRPDFRAAAVSSVLVLVLLGVYLGYTSSVDRAVDETVVTGPAALAGDFGGLAHDTTGAARVVELGGERTLTLTGFRTDPGPDLYVYLVPGLTTGESVDGGTRLGRLKGNVGDQQYGLPATLDLSRGATVVVWCRAFSVSFGAAPLEPAAA